MEELSPQTDAVTVHPFPVTTGEQGDTITLQLRHVGETRCPGQKAVLILHGGNSSSDTFRHPRGGLAAYLVHRGWDVWLLDWRGSPYVVDPFLNNPRNTPLGGSVAEECRLFGFDNVAREDVPAALSQVREHIGNEAPISVVGHCVAGGVVAMAVAFGALESVKSVVLTALGLFYEVPWDGRIKVEDYILERIQGRHPACRGISPRKPGEWPVEMVEAYGRWPEAWKLPEEPGAPELYRRLSFMVGKPWAPPRLDPSLHGDVLERIFGTMHLGVFLHSGQMVRRGFAAPFGAPDIIDRPRIADRHAESRMSSSQEARVTGSSVPRGGGLPNPCFDPEPFRKKRITLVGGAQNRVWHRDCLDLMYEWLREIPGDLGAGQYVKHIVPDYGLQDLYWHPYSHRDVYPLIEAGL